MEKVLSGYSFNPMKYFSGILLWYITQDHHGYTDNYYDYRGAHLLAERLSQFYSKH